ncbi:MAG: type II toxin-antitoxin system toxin DNA ADP-ribosyl transferase DarT [Rhodanobacteraceae bacterium]
MPAPARTKIYHILHVDRLASVIEDGFLYCDARMNGLTDRGSTIGMTDIKQRRLTLPIGCHIGLSVGDCVPFYFCPRSVMLYLFHRDNHPGLTYHGGQEPIVHLEADLLSTVEWANRQGKRWAFTLSNAGAYYFESRCELTQLDEVNWDAVQTNKWSGQGVSGSVKEGKQAEFLIEQSFPLALVERVGVHSRVVAQRVAEVLRGQEPRPGVEIKRDWYY